MTASEPKLNFQYEKQCSGCSNLFDAAFYPFSNTTLCLYCYEKKHNKTLHKLRELLTLPDLPSVKQLDKPQCPKCKSSSTRRARLKEMNHSEYFCKDCLLMWEIE
jgi:hypothetical protein